MELFNISITTISVGAALLFGIIWGSIVERYWSSKKRQSQYDTIVKEFTEDKPIVKPENNDKDIQVIKRPSAQDLMDKQKPPKLRETEKAMEESLDQILS